MPQISNLKLKNFRSFSSWTEIDFSVINILTGANNSGKSSVIKAIQLLNDSNKTSFDVLNFANEAHGLDGYQSIINNETPNNDLEFIIEVGRLMDHSSNFEPGYGWNEESFRDLNLPVPDKLTIELSYSNDSGEGVLNTYCLKYDDDVIIRVVRDQGEKHSLYVNFKWLLINHDDVNVFDLNNYKINLSNEFKEVLESKLEKYVSNLSMTKKQWEFKATPFAKSIRGPFNEASIIDIVNRLIPFNERKETILETKLTNLLSDDEKQKFKKELTLIEGKEVKLIFDSVDVHLYFESFIRYSKNILTDLLNHDYIPHLRSETQRLYSLKGKKTKLNELLDEVAKKGLNTSRRDFLNKWLRRFNIGDEAEFIPIKNFIDIQIKRNGKSLDLADLGTSCSWLLPILLSIATVDDFVEHSANDIPRQIDKNRIRQKEDGMLGIRSFSSDYNTELDDLEEYKDRWFKKIDLFDYNTIIVEEPEMNLHPDSQSKLAELFVEASNKFDIQFVIETHSEYLIRKLQQLVTQGTIHSSDCSVYYFNEGQNEGKAQRIELSELGNLKTEFGSGFFDESTTLRDELINLQEKKELEKRIKELTVSNNIKCVVLTEDKEFIKNQPEKSCIGKLLKASGFRMNEVELISYETSSQLNQALGMARIADKNDQLKQVIIHIDSDGGQAKREKEIKKFIDSKRLDKTSSFVTSYNDIEGYFINSEHINCLYPDFTKQDIDVMILDGIKKLRDESIKILSQHLDGHSDIASAMFDLDPQKYVHTKKLKSYMHVRLKGKVNKQNILQYSDFLKVDKLSIIANEIWGEPL